jgi:uncharacterized RDD family membrane protein YckC
LWRCTARLNTDFDLMEFTHRHFVYAGFMRRTVAFVLDNIIIGLISTTLAVAILGNEYLQLSQQKTLASQLDWRLLIFEQGLPAIWVIAFWMTWMATPGKLLLDCQIVDANSMGKPQTIQLVVRYLSYLISAIPLGLGFIWIIFDKRKQGWHDKLAKTLVIMQDESLHTLEAYQ